MEIWVELLLSWSAAHAEYGDDDWLDGNHRFVSDRAHAQPAHLLDCGGLFAVCRMVHTSLSQVELCHLQCKHLSVIYVITWDSWRLVWQLKYKIQ